MKLIVCTHTRGRRTAFHMDQGGEIFFQDPQPPPEALVTLDFPGLRRMNRTSLVKWLSSRETTRTGHPAAPRTAPGDPAEEAPPPWSKGLPPLCRAATPPAPAPVWRSDRPPAARLWTSHPLVGD